MKKSNQNSATAVMNGSAAEDHKNNGNSHTSHSAAADLSVILASLQSMREGDFSVRLPGSWTGLEGKIADTFNAIVAANQQMSQELKRVGQVVGKEGRTRERTRFHESRGAWGEMEVSINTLVEDLLRPTEGVTRAIAAVAQGNLTQTVRLDVDGRPLEGEFLRSANIVNTMIQQLGVFTAEVTRVAREVGTDGKLGGQALVPGVAGTWKDLTDSVNSMASNLTGQVRNIAEVATAVASGDLSRKITVDVRGEILQLKEAINTIVDQLRSFASEVTRVAREVGTDGKLGGQAVVVGVAGTWKDLTDSVNAMAGNLTAQVRNIAEVTTAVARGDLSRKITVDVKGEILDLKDTINTMVDQLNAFAGEVTRVAREVGTEGKLGGQAQVPGVGGTWKDLTDNVNFMASNLTGQVRNIAEVATAIATGDLSRKITVDVRGEILQLKETLNTMVDQLNRFAGEVTRVAREVGTEGRLGGQAKEVTPVFAIPGEPVHLDRRTGKANPMKRRILRPEKAQRREQQNRQCWGFCSHSADNYTSHSPGFPSPRQGRQLTGGSPMHRGVPRTRATSLSPRPIRGLFWLLWHRHSCLCFMHGMHVAPMLPLWSRSSCNFTFATNWGLLRQRLTENVTRLGSSLRKKRAISTKEFALGFDPNISQCPNHPIGRVDERSLGYE